jgi:hypothetical protein
MVFCRDSLIVDEHRIVAQLDHLFCPPMQERVELAFPEMTSANRTNYVSTRNFRNGDSPRPPLQQDPCHGQLVQDIVQWDLVGGFS